MLFRSTWSNNVIFLDPTAHGIGWHIDSNPGANSNDCLPNDRMDLLTAILHELGHSLGLEDQYGAVDRDDVMSGMLIPGERRLPKPGEARRANRSAATGTHYLLAPVNIGVLPPGKSIVIVFRARVANPMPAGACAIVNQGTVTATGVSVLTDEPRSGGAADPTVTTVLVPGIAATFPATDVLGNQATLQGSAGACGDNAVYYFQYGRTLSYEIGRAHV